MITLALLPFAASLAVRSLVSSLTARCTPRWAARGLVAVSLVVALGTGLVLCVVAVLGFVEIPSLGRFGQWDADVLSDRFAVSVPVAVAAAAVAVALLVASVVQLCRTVCSFAAAVRSCRALGPGVDGLVVVDDDRVAAYAVPAFRGRTVISRGLLRGLDSLERRAVLAHEDAHLRHRHFVYVQAAELAAAANPLLRPAAAAVRRAVEAWADDDAATLVGDRVCVARAVAKASLARRGSVLPHAGLGITEASDLAYRMRNLLGPVPRRTGPWVAVLVAIAAGCTASAVAVGVHAHAWFETAEQVFRVTR